MQIGKQKERKKTMGKEFLGGYTEGWWQAARKNRALVRRYNTMDPELLWEKYQLLKELLGAIPAW